jgi:Xaa-Pro aminopeptidase
MRLEGEFCRRVLSSSKDPSDGGRGSGRAKAPRSNLKHIGGPPREEVDRKVERLARASHDAGLGGVLLTTHWNFNWLTAGGTNRIDISREAGAGALLVSSTGHRYVLANAIEMPRLANEVLAGLAFEPVEFPWVDERTDPAFLARRATDVLAGGPVGADSMVGAAQPFETALSRLRSLLEPEELIRYRALGGDVGRALGDFLRLVPPGISEREVVREAAIALLRANARPLVLLAAADDRLLRYRHPIPTSLVWNGRLMVAVCAERDGLVVALSRLLSAGQPDAEMTRRLTAAQGVLSDLLDASIPGATAASLFQVAVGGYARRGFPGEETKHHQGGSIGYRSREWIAHPRSQEVIATPVALAWNPSITGTKVEETCLVTSTGVEVITSSPGWPSTAAIAQERTILLPDHLIVESG